MVFAQPNATIALEMSKVSYTEGGETKTGILSLIVRSTVSPEFDLAYIDFDRYWKVVFVSQLLENNESIFYSNK